MVSLTSVQDTFILPSARFHARFLLPPEQRKDYLAKYSSSMSNFLTRTNQCAHLLPFSRFPVCFLRLGGTNGVGSICKSVCNACAIIA